MAKALGRIPPSDWEHYEKYPLSALPELPAKAPVVLGINWYANFDDPVKDSQGRYWIGRASNLGPIRGGHCVCLKPDRVADYDTWWRFYDQGTEGSCVGFGWSRAMSLLNRMRYDGLWLYHNAQRVDEWPGEDYDGTTLRAGGNVLRDQGHARVLRGRTQRPRTQYGISAFRWENRVEVIHQVLGTGGGAVPMLNSWGADPVHGYPHVTWVPDETLARLIREDGDVAVPTDR